MKYRAGWIVINSETIIENGLIEINHGKISGFGSAGSIKRNDVEDLGPGVITPSLINCHTHLELSPLKNQIPFEKGFEEWVKILIHKREKLSEEDFDKGIEYGIDELKRTGCFTIGEISSLFLSLKNISGHCFNGIFFKEYLGNNPDFSGIEKKDFISSSYAGHAPHSTSPLLLKELKKATLHNNLPFSIHTAESDAESEFIMRGEGSWADFLSFRGIDYKSWPVKNLSPVSYLEKLGILDNKTMCVHLINTEKEDLSILKDRKSKICLCPRSNNNLHKKLPDLDEIINLKLDFCLGTDSHASVESLSIFDEMKYINENFKNVPPKSLFNAATIKGAEALNLENQLGDLGKGKEGNFIYLDIESVHGKDILEKLVNSDFKTIKSFSDTIQ